MYNFFLLKPIRRFRPNVAWQCQHQSQRLYSKNTIGKENGHVDLFNVEKRKADEKNRSRTSTTSALWGMRQLKKNQGVVEGVRKIEYSQLSVDLDFRNDHTLAHQYENYKGGVRIGKLFEDMDACAGNVAHLHVYSPSTPKQMKVVTVSVDSIHVFSKLSLDMSLVLTGKVSYVGRTSLEIEVSLMHKDKVNAPIMTAYFLMAARLDGNSFPVPPLDLSNESDKLKIEKGKKRNDKRKRETTKCSELKNIELDLPIHVISSSNQSVVFVEDNKCQSIILCEPQEKNTAGQIFGGYLMQKAYELAFANVIQVTECKEPLLLGVDDISFIHPVEIASILTFNSVVTYSDPNKKTYQVRVTTDVNDLKTDEKRHSNTFYFAFECDSSNKVVLPRLCKDNEEDMQLYVDGKFRLESLTAECQLLKSDH